MVVVPLLRNAGNNPSAVMIFQRLIFSAKKFEKNIRSASGFFIASNSIRKKTRVIVVALRLV